MSRSSFVAWLALMSFAAAVLGCGAALTGYAQMQHPVALLGARGIPNDAIFNVFGFVLPGVLVASVALRLRLRFPATSGWAARLGAQLCVLAGLAFAAQGMLPLDPADIDARSSRLHAAAAMWWWLAFVPGGFLLAAGRRDYPERRTLIWVSSLTALVLLLFAASPWQPLPAAVAQRIVFVVWFVWAIVAAQSAARISRGAVSSPAPSPPTRT